MECNKDEALRAKSIAEGKLEKKEFSGAKKFALKAKNLYPGLDGISQLLTTLDVYVAAENKIGGEFDWYGVLGVNPSDDDETLRKQFRKLALILHPDKNKSVGADGAFKLISEAWSLLSDQAKRLAYNRRRGFRGLQQKGHVHASGPSPSASAAAAPPPPRGTCIFDFASKMASIPKPQKNGANVPPTPTPPSHQRTDTFWTICYGCKMHYEYHRKYRNRTLLCTTCQKVFVASETAPPVRVYKSSNQVPQQRQHTINDRMPCGDVPVSQKSEPAQAGTDSFRDGNASVGSNDASVAAKAANNLQQSQDKLKRAYTKSYASAGLEGCVKKRKSEDSINRRGTNYNVAQGNSGFGTARGSSPRVYGFSGTSHRPNSTRDLNPFETRKMLIDTVREEILNKLSMQMAETTKALDKVRYTSKVGDISTGNNIGSSKNGKNGSYATKAVEQTAMDDANEEDPEAVSMTVPDPDFYDFDQDRSENSFADNEVWAAYDDDDGMPRFYALVSKVISREPFKLKISWLNSRTKGEFGTKDWVGSGFYKTVGEFRVGKYETCKSINAFSQKVDWSKSSRGSILIFPQKGDVWALYKNWSSNWNKQTPDEVIHNYDMVTVLDNYSEEQGISVAPLVKVVGFKTVFRPNMEPAVTKRIPKEEMFRFSHRVPFHLLTGQEAENAPKGCLELDPASTPLELVQVLTESNDVAILTEQTTADGAPAPSVFQSMVLTPKSNEETKSVLLQR